MVICVFIVFLNIVYVLSLPCEDIKTFVDGHNSVRLWLLQGLVEGQPKASKMYYMMWDEELAEKAAEWASVKEYGHNPDRTIKSGRFIVGENIYEFSSTALQPCDGKMAIERWYNEYKSYVYKKIEEDDSKNKEATGHYTQMIWMDTIYLGCGITEYTKDSWYYFYVVCNYGPTGNIIGEYPYKNTTDREVKGLTCKVGDCSKLYGNNC